MTDVDVLLNHARVRTRFACARVYELIEYMSLNKQFINFIFLYIMAQLLMLVCMFFVMKFMYKCILSILEYIKDWMDRY